MCRYVFSHAHIFFYTEIPMSETERGKMKRIREVKSSISRKILHIAINSLASSQASKCCRCRVIATPHKTHTHTHTSLLSCRENSRGRRGHHARCAKSWQRTGSGSKCFRGVRDLVEGGRGVRAGWGCRGTSAGWEKNTCDSRALMLSFFVFHRRKGHLWTFPSRN